jgi:serpin B
MVWPLLGALLLFACAKGSTDRSESDGPPTDDSSDDEPGTDDPNTDGDAFEPSAGVERSTADADAPMSELSAGFNDAGFGLWREQPAEDNFVFSPLSIGHALLMARGAADDATGDSIDAALALPEGLSAHQAWNAVDHGLSEIARTEEEVTITIADRIWPRLDVMPDQEWIDLLASEHGASVLPLDFAGDGSGSRDIINEWVSEQTQELIPELLPNGFIKSNTVLVLTDAVYFKARWRTVFGKYGPMPGDFTRLDGSTVEVEYMRELELSDKRGVGDGFEGAEIPYVNTDLSMLLLVPDEGSFEQFRDGLDQDLLDWVDENFETGPYELLMPGWETNSKLDLIDWLTTLGAAPGSYPKITPSAFLDAAVHGADITVDEWGTVAAAATAFGFAESGPPEPELTIAANRPFLYLIRHRPSGMVLFAGQVTDPS